MKRKDAKTPKAEDGTTGERYAGNLDKRGICNVVPRGWQESGANGR